MLRFLGAPGSQYRIYLTEYAVKTRMTVNTASGEDVNVGDVLFESCPGVGSAVPKVPSSPELVSDLKFEQIVIERQELASGLWRGIKTHTPPDPRIGPNSRVELPPCWSGPSLEKREEWEAVCSVMFGRDVTIGAFVGGKVKTIRVVRYDPRLTPLQIQDEVRKVWLGVFRDAYCYIAWAEGNQWNIEADIEYEDGSRSSILMDGWIHVEVQDRAGKYWYTRQSPAVN